jgi:hypothetical protein
MGPQQASAVRDVHRNIHQCDISGDLGTIDRETSNSLRWVILEFFSQVGFIKSTRGGALS